MIYCQECELYLDSEDVVDNEEGVPVHCECAYPVVYETAAGEDTIIKRWLERKEELKRRG